MSIIHLPRWAAPLGVAIALFSPALGADDDSRWPRVFNGSDGTQLVVHQPQLDRWEDYQRLFADAAVVLTEVGAEEDHIGVMTLTAETEADHKTRIVHLRNIEIEQVLFPVMDETKATAAAETVRNFYKRDPIDVPLDDILANLARTQIAVRDVPVSHDPPRIIISEKDAILVRVHGEPQYQMIEGTNVEIVLNTASDLFRHQASGKHYLLRHHTWLEAPELAGPWTVNKKLPRPFFTLAKTPRLSDVRIRVRGRTVSSIGPPDAYVVFEPTELLTVYGPRDWEPIAGTDLQFLRNTDSDVFKYAGDGLYYALFSGRWFRTTGSDQPLEFCTHDLPEDFARIPPDHDAGRVLVSVPGTDQSHEAVIAAHIPRTATVRRRDVEAEVSYLGDPVFVPIEGTAIRMASNTSHAVLEVNGTFYGCRMGVWFVADDAEGPWRVCDDVPDEIYDIPPSSRAYPLTYVQVYDSNPDEVVFGYLAGYEQAFASGGVLVYGVGDDKEDEYTPDYYLHQYKHWTPLHFSYLQLRDTYGHGFYYDHLAGRFQRSGVAHAHQANRMVRLAPYDTWPKGVSENRFNDRSEQARSYTPPGYLVRGGPRLYAAPGGSVYRQQQGVWQQHSRGGWRETGAGGSAIRVPRRVVNSYRSWGSRRQSQFRRYHSTRGRSTRSSQGLGAGNYR